MSDTTATEAEAEKCAKNNLILTVTQSGSICSVVEAPQAMHDEFAANSESLSIDQLWNDEFVEKIRNALRRAVRSRESCGLDVDHPDGLVQEFIFVPQGADRILMIVRDLTEQKRAQMRTRRLAYTDDVTGLPNREYLFLELQKITDIQRLKEGRSAVICIHVGHFEDYGYALSSSQQDDVLGQLASRLKSHLRGSNKDGATDYERYSVVSRSDFRQFCIVLPSIESGEDAEAVAQRLVADMRQPMNVANRLLNVNVFGGISLYPQDGMDSAALYENAVAAMEDARGESNAPIKFHSGTVRLRTLQRTDLEAELKSALLNDDYDLNYLPTIDARTGAPKIIEALLRWPDAVLGSQPTRKIVRVAERTGLILPIGSWVLKSACAQLQVWRAAGHTDVRVAVNLSAQELVSEGIVASIERALSETNTDPADLDIELKEHILFREAQSDFAICSRLKALGVRLVVDDYGVGTCSLAHLSQSPVDALKIDNSFIANLENNERDVAACGAALKMAAELGLDVIAEGIETEYQAEVMRNLGCRYLQGFLISTPMTACETLEYLQFHAKDETAHKGHSERF
ncbi:MAG: EAL domain-containing protein [Gammaproteobacteria bacterium]|nr:EAL domain-containing protein [Gammaproteobacteria bacterium]